MREILDGLPLVGGHPAVDFVNTQMISLKKDYLATYSSIVLWFETLGLASAAEVEALRGVDGDSPAAQQLVAGLHELRSVLHCLIYNVADGGPNDPGALEQFRRLHADAAARLELGWAGDRFTLEIGGDDPRLLLWRMTRLAAELVTTPHGGRLRCCARRPACDWVFLDTSKAGRRRWCTPHICGNRVRLATFMKRHAAPRFAADR